MAWESGRAIHRSIAAGALVFLAGWAPAQTATAIPGGTMRTSLGRGIVLNKESSLERVWIYIQDPAIPVEFKNPVGITTTYTLRGEAGAYEYSSVVHLTAREPISAVEIRFLLFDIWGQKTKSLIITEIAELTPGTTKELNPKWGLPSETEAAQYYASIAYISRVRTKDGRVLAANSEFVVEQARKFSEQFKEVDIESGKAKAD